MWNFAEESVLKVIFASEREKNIMCEMKNVMILTCSEENEFFAHVAEMLAEKGITISDLEMRMLLEAAVAEFNNAFQQTTEKLEEAT